MNGARTNDGIELNREYRRDPRDLVFDLSRLEHMSIGDLGLLITAQQIAEADDYTVWALSTPRRVAAILEALGLDSCFLTFPEEAPRA